MITAVAFLRQHLHCDFVVYMGQAACGEVTLPQWQPHGIESHNRQLIPWVLKLAPAV